MRTPRQHLHASQKQTRLILTLLCIVTLDLVAQAQTQIPLAQTEATHAQIKAPNQSTNQVAGEAAIEAYCKELDLFKKSNPNRARFFGDVSAWDQSGVTLSAPSPKWREFKTRKTRESAATGDNLYDVADIWIKDEKVVLAEFWFGSPSGDWSQSVTYYFRDDGTLAKMQSTYAGFNLNPFANPEEFGARLVQTRVYDANGKRLRKSLQCFELGEKGRRRKCSGDYSHHEGVVYLKAHRLPLYKLLNSRTKNAHSTQTTNELDATARTRIEQARASIVTISIENESAQPVSQALGFFIRNDLVATDGSVLNAGSRVRVVAAKKEATFKVLSSGNYFLPYILLEKQAEVSPLPLGDSERIAVNDSVYMSGDNGAISAGTVTSTTTINRDSAFLISLTINSSNKGAPIFNRNGEVIGIAAETPDGQGAGLAFPSSLLAKLKHLGEPGVGAGRGDGPFKSAPTNTEPSAASQVDTRPRRLRGPMPQYTDAARANGTEGTVLLRVLVGEDGDVTQVRVIRGLPDGLTERAIAAARQTKFKPAMKDGKAVPFWVVVEMEFHIR